MTRNPLILYDSKIVLYFEGQWLLLDAVTELTGDTSIRLQGPNRKTIFGYSPALLKAREHTEFSITINTYITKGFKEAVFFRMAGFQEYSPRKLLLSYPEKLGEVQREATIYVLSPQGQYCLTGCSIESIDIPFQLDKVGQITVTFTAKTLAPQDKQLLNGLPIAPQGKHMLPGPVMSKMSGYEQHQIGQAITFQRQYTSLSAANCFNTEDIVTQGHRLTSDSNLGGVIQEYVTVDRLSMPDSFSTDLEISQSGFMVRQTEGLATRRLNIQSVNSLYWDFRATDTIEITGPKEEN